MFYYERHKAVDEGNNKGMLPQTRHYYTDVGQCHEGDQLAPNLLGITQPLNTSSSSCLT